MSDSTAVTKKNGSHPARLTPEMERMDALARQAAALASSTIVPTAYQNNAGNCLVAIDMAQRSGVGVLTVMQNLHIIQGRPSWGSSFLIGAVNACGRFTPMRFEMVGEVAQPGWGCRAVATSKEDGERLEGPWITWEMAQAEGWTNKGGSKWKTMPELMIRYRAAAFFSRLYAPELALGFLTREEAEDIAPPARARVRSLAEALDAEEAEVEILAPEPATAGADLGFDLED